MVRSGSKAKSKRPFARSHDQTSVRKKFEFTLPRGMILVCLTRRIETGRKECLAAAEPIRALKGKRAVAVVYSNYPADPRPRRAAEALANEEMALEVICLKETDDQPAHETFNGVEITRIPLKRRRGGKFSYILQYGSFILLAGAILAARTFKRRYHLVHVHNMPDILVFSALIPKLFGR